MSEAEQILSEIADQLKLGIPVNITPTSVYGKMILSLNLKK